MGQAKKRGTFEQRVEQAKARDKEIYDSIVQKILEKQNQINTERANTAIKTPSISSAIIAAALVSSALANKH